MQEILRLSLALCSESYLVGGSVRDTILGKNKITDLDIAVEGDGFGVAREISNQLSVKSSFVPLDKKHRTGRIVVPEDHGQITVDISSFRGSNIGEDLIGRDFTINAIAVHLWDVINGRVAQNIFDPLDGRRDIERRIIRICSETSLSDDPLRMLRAFRFASQLGFSIDPGTRLGISKSAKLIGNVSGERIRDELEIVLHCNRSTQIIEQMVETSLFWEIFPELLPTRGFEQNAFHHLDVWEHTIEALENMENLIENLESVFGVFSDRIREYIYEQLVSGRPRIWLLKLAILFHDSGKPFSLSVDEKGRRRFIGHEKISRSLILEAGGRLRLAARELSEVSSWVGGHMRLSILNLENLSDRALLRLHHKSGVHFVGLILIYLADISAARGTARKAEEFTRARMGAKKALELAFQEDEKTVKPLLDGVQLMEEFGLEQGPRLGSILRWLVTEQALGTIRDQEQARQALHRYLYQHPVNK